MKSDLQLPVFLHIPKNAGTYVLTKTMSLFRHYAEENKLQWDVKTQSWQTLRRIHITDNNFTLLTLFVYDPQMKYSNEFCNKVNDYCSSISLENFLDSLDSNFKCFSLIVEPRGIYLLTNGFIDKICNALNRTPFFCTILRNPLSRALSLYNYITTEQSKHEFTHNSIKSKTFEEYISSYEVEDSWLIRSLLRVPNNEQISETHYKQAYDIMKQFSIGTFENVDGLIFKAFKQYFPIETTLPADRAKINYNKNTIASNDIITKLSQDSIKKYYDRTHFDHLLYDSLIKNCGSDV